MKKFTVNYPELSEHQRKMLLREISEYVIGENYMFERPKEDYLPNVYRWLSAKNELRTEQNKRLKEWLEL